jgi:serine/threonine protein kinase
MPKLEDYVGQVLDEKYRLEQLLGQGGMGAVYLATHLGTDRYVALKLIAPQFMRNEEFVERFKREARAAGRLRHPNVVDVTDFGFARVKDGQVAYLVMEYLDGCTLGDVLAEEKSLPLDWVVDILEQVCSAVHEAHQMGIVHRDLKPDNIWLEPNRLGSYKVKVLDFGIAKLAETNAPLMDDDPLPKTLIDVPPEPESEAKTLPRVSGADLEKTTLLQPTDELKHLQVGDGVSATVQAERSAIRVEEGGDTKLFVAQTVQRGPGRPTERLDRQLHEAGDDDGTLLFDQGTRKFGAQTAYAGTASHGAALTRVGSIMGTPLYMSPEQCAGGHLDARADVYSIGVIAYQMLSGEPPFTGNTTAVIRAHREDSPRHLRELAGKIPKRVAGVIMTSLAKNPADRPQTAFALASSLRGQVDGIGSLYRRAVALYSEYFPKFVKMSFIAHIPVIVFTLFIIVLEIVDKLRPPKGLAQKIVFISLMAIAGLGEIVAYFLAAAAISGLTAIIVTQLSAAPLRPVELHQVFGVLKRRWRPFLNTSIRVTLRILVGYCLLIIPGLVMSVRYALYAPVVLIEGLQKKAARERARELASRSWRTVIIVSILQVVIPITVSALLGRIHVGLSPKEHQFKLTSQISQQVAGLLNILVVPLMSIVPALLYLKMRQLGGESLSIALAQIQEVDDESKKWQQRMRTRLSLYTPHSQKTTTGQS